MNKDILTLIEEASHGFSKGQRSIARYIIENYDKAAFYDGKQAWSGRRCE